VPIAEAAKCKVLLESAGCHLRPANALQVARRYAQQFAERVELFNQFSNRRAELRTKVTGVTLYLCRNKVDQATELWLPFALHYTRLLHEATQDPHIRISVYGNSSHIQLQPIDFFYRVMHGPIVDRITAVQQRSIDVKEVGVGGAPVKSCNRKNW